MDVLGDDWVTAAIHFLLRPLAVRANKDSLMLVIVAASISDLDKVLIAKGRGLVLDGPRNSITTGWRI